ncbi:MAG: hypothetical protein ACK4IY_10000, partial [Chitinophagales bacterium]
MTNRFYGSIGGRDTTRFAGAQLNAICSGLCCDEGAFRIKATYFNRHVVKLRNLFILHYPLFFYFSLPLRLAERHQAAVARELAL